MVAPQFGQHAGELVEVSALVDDATVGVVRVVEVADVVGVAETLGATEVVVRGADVVELEGCVDVVVTGATVLVVLEVGELDVDVVENDEVAEVVEVAGVTGVVDVVVEVSLASCLRSFSRLSLASARARFALSTCRLARMRSFTLEALFSA